MPVTIDLQLINCSNWGQANVHVCTKSAHNEALQSTWLILMTDKDNEDDACENELNSSGFRSVLVQLVCLCNLTTDRAIDMATTTTTNTDHWSLAR